MNYKKTLNLPRTDFPMKADLVKKEPEILARWESENLYQQIRQSSKGRKPYMLHDGPPYANGHIHVGTAFNKILKDIIIRSKQMAGFDAPFVPGWDCHGLPIEHKVDMELGDRKKSMSRVDIRRHCRSYAEKFINIQREEFRRLGVTGEWDHPYLTMNFPYEAVIAREFGRFALNGSLMRAKKPIYWCISCQTALAEAEVEYHEHTSPSIYVKFPMISDLGSQYPELAGKEVSIVIWTTTPWTIPANLAIALHPGFDYVAVDVGNGQVLILAEGLMHICLEAFDIHSSKVLTRVKAADLERLKAKHPLYDRESLIVLAPYVTLEAGTGCVHTAPGHGREDYETGSQYGLEVYSPVDDAGRFTADVEYFAGLGVFEANRAVNEKLHETGALLLEEELPHDYPHCWRCKKPVIFRATKQWFISLEKNDLRRKALAAINEVCWIPAWGRDRIYGLIENRPDWCISRQRAWGSPITILYCRECDHMLINQEIIDRVCGLIAESGADIWFTAEEKDLVPPDTRCPECGATTFRKETDILDVWFDSGVSYAAVMETRAELASPSDLYLEGSDQHRGWFHSALLCSVGTRGEPPYRNVLTHGFVVDGQGKAMHKSGGNVISPLDLIKDYGAEIIRLWVAGEDYRDNIRLSDEILQRLTEAYRRIRNTCRYLLGNLSDFEPERDSIPYEELEELDRWALHRLHEMSERVRKAYTDFEFHSVYHNLHNFCVLDLSSFYLDIIKDRLYVSAQDSPARRSAQTAMHEILAVLVRLMAPVLCFTADEIWRFMPDAEHTLSVHMDLFVPVKEQYKDPELASRWEEIIKVRREVTKALEIARKEKQIGHSLDARVILGLPEDLLKWIDPYREQLHSLFIVSAVQLVPSAEVEGGFESEELDSVKIKVAASNAPKCERCWVRDPTVGEDDAHPLICNRCLQAIDGVKDLDT